MDKKPPLPIESHGYDSEQLDFERRIRHSALMVGLVIGFSLGVITTVFVIVWRFAE